MFVDQILAVFDAVFAALYSAIMIQYAEFFTILELLQTLFGIGAPA